MIRTAMPPVAAHPTPILVHGATLTGDLTVPGRAQGLVLFAHGSGSSRRSPRNRRVAETLQQAGLATLLFDLLTPEEEAVDASSGELRFDIDLLASRLLGATDWVATQPETRWLRLGYFGASTGAAAALVAAALHPEAVEAIVSRGGRPDLAGSYLYRVRAPTLLLVGGRDTQVLDLNRHALAQLPSDGHALVVVPGAGHLFEEPGALEQVAARAAQWFTRHLATPSADGAVAAGAP